jgi:hypothetical protein
MSQSSESLKPCALLWNESFLWGLTAFEALKSAGLPFDLIRSDVIKAGKLRNYSMLFVPGGWASNKIKSLGDEGVSEIRSFVKDGGSYLGFCGGAGLATHDGIGLLDIKRIPTKERVPSFSGRTRFTLRNHYIWNDISDPVFNVWWPSQFSINDTSVNILAVYKEALPDSFSSDLNAGDVQKHQGGWEAIEKTYGINLDPARLYGQPALVEGRYGRGKVILSLIHFDSPDDANGLLVLRNLWSYLSCVDTHRLNSNKPHLSSELPSFQVSGLLNEVEDLIEFGERNFLWFRRNRLLLQWKRGIRGLEYCTLYALIKAVVERAGNVAVNNPDFNERLDEIGTLLQSFKEKAEKLLHLERMALQDGHKITYEKSDNPEITELRTELFANSKSYGGSFKILLDNIDELLFDLLKSQKRYFYGNQKPR